MVRSAPCATRNSTVSLAKRRSQRCCSSAAPRAAAIQHGSPPSRQILFSATVVPAGVKTKMNHYPVGEVLLASVKKPVLPPVVAVQHYSIDYSFEGCQLHFLPPENATYRSVLTLMAASFDSEGTMLTGISGWNQQSGAGGLQRRDQRRIPIASGGGRARGGSLVTPGHSGSDEQSSRDDRDSIACSVASGRAPPDQTHFAGD